MGFTWSGLSAMTMLLLVAGMIEEVEEPLVLEQALDEGQVALVVLDDEFAQGPDVARPPSIRRRCRRPE